MSQHRDNPPLPAPDRFADRVMAAIADEPVPTPTRTFLAATRSGSMHDAASAMWVAWHLATVRRWQIGLRVRARSFALVLAVTAVLGTASVAGAAALRVAAEPIIDLLRPGVVELAPLEQPPAAGPSLDDQKKNTDQDDADGDDNEDESGDEDPEDVNSGEGDSDVDSPDDEDDPDGDEPDDDEDDPDEDVNDGTDSGTGSDDLDSDGGDDGSDDDGEASTD